MAQIDIERILDGMTLDEKIGQMFMGDLAGGEGLDVARRKLETYRFGALQWSGVFERFVRSMDGIDCGVCENLPLDEVAQYLAEVKAASLEIMGVPVILCGDQEGGLENTIFRRREATLMPTQMGMGAVGSVEDVYRAGTVIAREMKLLGLDLLYGPSVDVNTNPENPEIGNRSFGEDPNTVAERGVQIIRACREQGVISAAKHFPGRGAGATDAHHHLERMELDRKRLESVELAPFRRAIEAGVDTFMMAHTVFPALDPDELPASLSPAVIRFLREEMGFDGVIMPDALSMWAIANHFELAKAPALCLEAGSDMAFLKVEEYWEPAFEAVRESVRAGRLTEERIDASVRRILKLKLKHGLFNPPPFSAEEVRSVVGCAEHASIARDLARRAVMVLCNEGGVLPLNAGECGPVLVVVPRNRNIVLSNDPVLSHDMLPRALGRHVSEVQTTLVHKEPDREEAWTAVAYAKNARTIVVAVDSGGTTLGYLELIESLLALGKPLVVVLTAPPYAATKLPGGVPAVVETFGITVPLYEAATDVMFGTLKASGKLPVTISEEMPRGWAGVAI